MTNHSFRWVIPWVDAGYLQIYNFMIRNYAKAGLTRSEFLFIVHLAAYHYESPAGAAIPAQETIAEEMGYAHRNSVNRLAQSLQDKGMLIVTQREGYTCVYDLSPFSRRMVELWQEGGDHSNVQEGDHSSVQVGTHPGVHEEEKDQEEKTKNQNNNATATAVARRILETGSEDDLEYPRSPGEEPLPTAVNRSKPQTESTLTKESPTRLAPKGGKAHAPVSGKSSDGWDHTAIDLSVPSDDDPWWSIIRKRFTWKKRFKSLSEKNRWIAAVERLERLEYGQDFLERGIEWGTMHSWSFDFLLNWLVADGTSSPKARNHYVYWLEKGAYGPEQRDIRNHTNSIADIDYKAANEALLKSLGSVSSD